MRFQEFLKIFSEHWNWFIIYYLSLGYTANGLKIIHISWIVEKEIFKKMPVEVLYTVEKLQKPWNSVIPLSRVRCQNFTITELFSLKGQYVLKLCTNYIYSLAMCIVIYLNLKTKLDSQNRKIQNAKTISHLNNNTPHISATHGRVCGMPNLRNSPNVFGQGKNLTVRPMDTSTAQYW